MVKIKNVNGSGRFSVPYGYNSWLDYWEANARDKSRICGASNCSGSDLVGAHVQKANSTDKSYYITPLCRSCNRRTDEFTTHWVLVPVPSNL